MILSMFTKNSAEKVGADFETVWVSSLQVPYRAIILVDDSDTPITREFVKRFADAHGKELVVERSRLYGWHKPTRATARQTAIDIFFEQFSDEWLFSLDDDFILRNGWWERVAWVRVRGLDEVAHAIENFKVRGGLHDTLLRRRAMEELRYRPGLMCSKTRGLRSMWSARGGSGG